MRSRLLSLLILFFLYSSCIYADDSGSVTPPNSSQLIKCCYNKYAMTAWTQDTCPANSFEVYSESRGGHIWYWCKSSYVFCEYLTQSQCDTKLAEQPTQPTP